MVEAEQSLLDRAAQRRLTERQQAVADELRRLIDAGLAQLREHPDVLPKVAAVVAGAGSSNDAFYRAFGSREAYLAAIVDDVARNLLAGIGQARDAGADPGTRVRLAVDAVLDQARDPQSVATTRAVLAVSTARPGGDGIGLDALAGRLASLLADDLEALGSPDPARDARTLARAVLGEVQTHVLAGTTPATDVLGYFTGLVARLGAAGDRAARPRPGPRR